MRVHTGEKPFTCFIPGCPKTFKQKSQQYSHMRQAHNYNTDMLKGSGKAFMQPSLYPGAVGGVGVIIPQNFNDESPKYSKPTPKKPLKKAGPQQDDEGKEIHDLFNQLKKKRSKRAQRADQEDILQSEDEED